LWALVSALARRDIAGRREQIRPAGLLRCRVLRCLDCGLRALDGDPPGTAAPSRRRYRPSRDSGWSFTVTGVRWLATTATPHDQRA